MTRLFYLDDRFGPLPQFPRTPFDIGRQHVGARLNTCVHTEAVVDLPLTPRWDGDILSRSIRMKAIGQPQPDSECSRVLRMVEYIQADLGCPRGATLLPIGVKPDATFIDAIVRLTPVL